MSYKNFIMSLAMVVAIATGTPLEQPAIDEQSTGIEVDQGQEQPADDEVDQDPKQSANEYVQQAAQGYLDLLSQMLVDIGDVKELIQFKAQVAAGLDKTGYADITSYMEGERASRESLEAEVDVLDSKQITEDFYFTNSETTYLDKNQYTNIKEWTVKAGETMNLEVHFDTDQDRINQNNSVKLALFMDDDVLVANSQDDGDGGDDNSVLTLLYRAKVS